MIALTVYSANACTKKAPSRVWDEDKQTGKLYPSVADWRRLIKKKGKKAFQYRYDAGGGAV